MFIRNKPTEPFFFILFKKICSLSFIIIIILYAINQISDLSTTGLSKPRLGLSNKQFRDTATITMEFCNAGTINVTNCQLFFKFPSTWNNFVPNNYKCRFNRISAINESCARYTFVHDYTVLLWLNISIGQSSQPALLNNSSEILNILNSRNMTDVYPGILSIYMTKFKMNGTNYQPNYNSFFLTNGQVAIIDYSPIIKSNIYDTYLFGLESRTESYSSLPIIDFDARMNILPLSSPQNTLQLGMKTRSSTIHYQEEFYPGSKY
jgi:hypothetical protein